MSDRPNIITSEQFWKALVAANVLREDESYRRIVIDVQPPPGIVIMYLERNADERLLGVATTLDGIEITGVPS